MINESDAKRRHVPDLKSLRIQEILNEENEDLQQILRLQGELKDAKSALRAKDKEIGVKDKEIASLKAELNRRPVVEISGDPDGYYRALGLHPDFAQGLTKEQAREVVQSVYRVYAKIFHTDNGGDLERMKKINVAHDYLAPKPEQPTIPRSKR